jgi:hypothetical protein
MPKYKIKAHGWVEVIVEADDDYQAADMGNMITDEQWLEHGVAVLFYEPDDMPEEVFE